MCKGPEEVSSMVASLLSLEIFIPLCIRQVFWAPVVRSWTCCWGSMGEQDRQCMSSGSSPCRGQGRSAYITSRIPML